MSSVEHQQQQSV